MKYASDLVSLLQIHIDNLRGLKMFLLLQYLVLEKGRHTTLVIENKTCLNLESSYYMLPFAQYILVYSFTVLISLHNFIRKRNVL